MNVLRREQLLQRLAVAIEELDELNLSETRKNVCQPLGELLLDARAQKDGGLIGTLLLLRDTVVVEERVKLTKGFGRAALRLIRECPLSTGEHHQALVDWLQAHEMQVVFAVVPEVPPISENLRAAIERHRSERGASGYDEYAPIEPGMKEICRIINESGAGLTRHSCEGHLYLDGVLEQVDYPGYVMANPYVSFSILDWPRVLSLLPHLLNTHEPFVYYFEVELQSPGGASRTQPNLIIRVNFDDGYQTAQCWSPEGEVRRQAALESGRHRLAETLRTHLR